MSKVVVIGIDALDSVTLSKFKKDLPNFRRLMEKTSHISFDGVFPPDSPTSWASIYTGLNPAKHGIVLFVDPLGRVSKMITEDVDDSTIRGKTFWDIAGKMGKKVCIILHLLGYPVWSVNGIMIGRSGVTNDVQSFPRELPERYHLSQFSWDLRLFPGKNKKKYLDAARRQILNETRFGLKIMEECEWDLFFMSFGELDPIQYSFWSYYDENDSSYPGNNPYRNVIKDFYGLYDDMLGNFLSSADPEVITIVVSDHGIGSRPVKLININEFLRRKSLLILTRDMRQKGMRYLTYNMLEGIKRNILKAIGKYDLGNMAASALHIFPIGKELFILPKHIDWKNGTAYLTDQSGIKNYPYGGIIIRRENIKNIDYEKLRNLIIEELYGIREPNTNRRIINWICKREELYSGEYINRYPEILFELKEDYGAGTMTPAPLFGKSLTHNIVPGCHKQHHAVFLISNIEDKIIRRNSVTLMHIAPTILDLLGVDWRKFDFDGRSILGGNK